MRMESIFSVLLHPAGLLYGHARSSGCVLTYFNKERVLKVSSTCTQDGHSSVPLPMSGSFFSALLRFCRFFPKFWPKPWHPSRNIDCSLPGLSSDYSFHRKTAFKRCSVSPGIVIQPGMVDQLKEIH